MMEGSIPIQPFGFDRVFRFNAAQEEKTPSVPIEELHAQIAALQERIEQMRQEQDLNVFAARAEGLSQGLEQARGERQEALLAATDAMQSALEDVDVQLDNTRRQIERDATEVALCAADILAGQAVKAEPSRAVDEALGRALRQVSRGTALQVKVHPSIFTDMERLVAVRQSGERRALNVTVVEDPEIMPHDAHISWAGGGLIVSAEARRAAVIRELGDLIDPEEKA